MLKCNKQLKAMEGILAHINDAYAPNTIRAYRADFSEWISFCMKKGGCLSRQTPLSSLNSCLA